MLKAKIVLQYESNVLKAKVVLQYVKWLSPLRVHQSIDVVMCIVQFRSMHQQHETS